MDTSYVTECKIRKEGKMYFCVAGMGSDYIKDIAARSIKECNSFFKISNVFEKNIRQPIIDSLSLFLKTDSLRFIQEYTDNNVIFEIAFFGFDNTTPIEIKLYFVLKDNYLKKIDFDMAVFANIPIKNDNKNRVITDVLGQDGAFLKLDSSGNLLKHISKNGLIKTAEYIIKEQIKATPYTVGEPIDIIKITPTSETWITKKRQTCN